MFKSLTHRSFFANLIAACILFFLMGLLFFASLGLITRHGQTEKVPDVEGQPFSSAKSLLTSLSFNVIVQDSAYIDSLPPLAVVRQMPDSGSIVKVDRTIYLTLNKKSPPLTAMPELVNYSFRSAVMTLESQRLQLGDTLYKPDIAKDAVLQQLYQGKPIKAGEMLPEGSRITLILGDGIGNIPNPVPNLIGLTYQQALDLLSGSSLSPGVVLTSGTLTDTMNAFIFKQDPPPMNAAGQPNYIRAGESIDIWISQSNPTDTMKVDSSR